MYVCTCIYVCVCVCVCVYTHTHTHTYTHIYAHIIIYYWLFQHTEFSSLCYTVGPFCLCIHVNLKLLSYFPPNLCYPFGNPKFVFYISDSVSVL